MSVERRGQVIRVPITLVNWQQEEPTDRGEGRQPFMDDTSRVSREAQARICERLGVRFPGATRPTTESKTHAIGTRWMHARVLVYATLRRAIRKMSRISAIAVSFLESTEKRKRPLRG